MCIEGEADDDDAKKRRKKELKPGVFVTAATSSPALHFYMG